MLTKILYYTKKMVKKKNIKNIVYIGGGVSSIFSVIKLLDAGVPGHQITIIEKGKNVYERKTEEVMNGFGGAGTWSDFKFIYSLNQGGHLSKYTGEKKANLLLEEIKEIVRRFHPVPEEIVNTGIDEEPEFIKDSNFILKQSECEHLGTDNGFEMMKNIYNYFLENDVKMFFNLSVEDIDFEGKKILVDENFVNEEGENGIIYYDELIIATGKSGIGFMQKLIDKYKLETEPKPAQIGVRFESEYKYFKKLAKHFYDFKLYKKFDENVSARSFCINNERSFIAIEETYGMKSYNGHAYKDDSYYNGRTNFGIMLEVKGIKEPFKFTKKLVELANTEKVGKCYSPGRREPTVESKKIGKNVFRMIYGKYAEYIFQFIKELQEIFDFGDDYIIYIPEIKYLTDEIIVNYKDLSLKEYPNVHLGGDSLSARGITVSAAHGMYIAENIEPKIKKLT